MDSFKLKEHLKVTAGVQSSIFAAGTSTQPFRKLTASWFATRELVPLKVGRAQAAKPVPTATA